MLWRFFSQKGAEEQFCFYSFLVWGKASHNNVCTSCFGLAKTWLFAVGKAAIFCLKEIIQILGQFLSVT